MAIDIDDGQTEDLIRKLAELTGETLEEAVRIAIAERYQRMRQSREGHSLRGEPKEIALRCASLPVIADMTDDEILGYDEFGVPTR